MALTQKKGVLKNLTVHPIAPASISLTATSCSVMTFMSSDV